MPFQISLDSQQLDNSLSLVVAAVSVVYTTLTIALAIWAYKDMRSRTRDGLLPFLAAIVVAILNLPGLLIYFILRPRETLSDKYQRSLEEEALLREIEGKSSCPGCSAHTHPDWRLCPYCHTKLKKTCINCSKLLELQWTICPYCEHSQGRVDRVFPGQTPLRSHNQELLPNPPSSLEDIITEEEKSLGTS